MKKTIIEYSCDKCGDEFKPYSVKYAFYSNIVPVGRTLKEKCIKLGSSFDDTDLCKGCLINIFSKFIETER